jgi:hypothetical protein
MCSFIGLYGSCHFLCSKMNSEWILCSEGFRCLEFRLSPKLSAISTYGFEHCLYKKSLNSVDIVDYPNRQCIFLLSG